MHRQKHWQPGTENKICSEYGLKAWWELHQLLRLTNIFRPVSVSPLHWYAGRKEKRPHLNAKGGVREQERGKVQIAEESCRKAEGNHALHSLGKMLIDERKGTTI